MKLKVIFFEAGLAGGSVYRLAQLLENWDGINVPCALVTFFDKKKCSELLKNCNLSWSKSLSIDGVKQPDPIRKVAGMRMPTWHAVRYFFVALKIFFSNSTSIAYFNNSPYSHLPAICAAIILRIKIVSHLRTIAPFVNAEKALQPYIHKFVVLSNAAKEYYQQQGIPENKISVVYDSVDVERFDHAADYKNKKPYSTVSVGSLFFMKGHDICIKSLAIVKQVYPKVHLTIVGEGDYLHELKKLSNELSVNDNVTFLGYSNEIPKILSQNEIGILMSRKEGMPNAVYEYMAAGLPVIVSDLPGINELVKKDVSGFIVKQESVDELAHCWIKLIEDKTLSLKMGFEGKQIVNEYRFSPDAERTSIKSIITGLIK
jgi:glycosyltransferase involved in cell wall biosynthesis